MKQPCSISQIPERGCAEVHVGCDAIDDAVAQSTSHAVQEQVGVRLDRLVTKRIFKIRVVGSYPTRSMAAGTADVDEQLLSGHSGGRRLRWCRHESLEVIHSGEEGIRIGAWIGQFRIGYRVAREIRAIGSVGKTLERHEGTGQSELFLGSSDGEGEHGRSLGLPSETTDFLDCAGLPHVFSWHDHSCQATKTVAVQVLGVRARDDFILGNRFDQTVAERSESQTWCHHVGECRDVFRTTGEVDPGNHFRLKHRTTKVLQGVEGVVLKTTEVDDRDHTRATKGLGMTGTAKAFVVDGTESLLDRHGRAVRQQSALETSKFLGRKAGKRISRNGLELAGVGVLRCGVGFGDEETRKNKSHKHENSFDESADDRETSLSFTRRENGSGFISFDHKKRPQMRLNRTRRNPRMKMFRGDDW